MFEAATAPSGLTERVTRKPDLLILDMGLPGGSGLDIIREVRTWSGVPNVVLSARSDEDGKIAALDAGADNCLTKPFGIGELLAAPCTGQQRGPGAQAPPIAARSLGAVACRTNHYLRIYKAHLRHKLEADPAQPVRFLTETAVGYRLVC